MDIKEAGQVFKQIGNKFSILWALFPDKSIGLSELATILNVDISTISKAWGPLKRAGLINVVEVPRKKRGNEIKEISLTSLSYRIIADCQDHLLNKGAVTEEIRKDIIDSYVPYLESKDEFVRSKAFEQVNVKSQKNIIKPDCEFISFLEKKIDDNEYNKYKKIMMATLNNILNTSLEEYPHQYSNKFKDKIKEMIEDEKYDFYEDHLKYVLLQIYSKIGDREDSYKKLNEQYIKFLQNDNSYRSNIKEILVSKHRDKIDLLLLDLMKLLAESKDSFREKVSEAIDSFR